MTDTNKPTIPVPSGDSFHFEGNFSGAIINVKNSMTQVRQQIFDSPNLDTQTKTTLEELINKLEKELEKATPDQKEAVEAVTATLQTVSAETTKPKPNKTLLAISAEGLKQAAQNLSAALPSVLLIVTQIVDFVTNLAK